MFPVCYRNSPSAAPHTCTLLELLTFIIPPSRRHALKGTGHKVEDLGRVASPGKLKMTYCGQANGGLVMPGIMLAS